jgi:hypothetical protein
MKCRGTPGGCPISTILRIGFLVAKSGLTVDDIMIDQIELILSFYQYCSCRHFMLDVCEFVRVSNDTNSLNLLSVYFNGQHSKGSISGACNECRLTIDL